MERGPGLKVQRGESATGWWEFVLGRPDPRLAGVVTGLCGYRERAATAVSRRMAATTRVPIILSFGEPIDVAMSAGPDGGVAPERRYESFVAGFHAGYADTTFRGRQFGLQIDLTPLGAFRVFGMPASEIAGRVVDVAGLTSNLRGSSVEQLADLATWEGRFAAADELITSMVDRGPEPDPLVGWMWDQIEASAGSVRIGDLVDESGRSHRHVISRFREQVGLSPKAAAAVVRFERSAVAVAAGQRPADVAARFGYSDQSHLTREFGRLAGSTPRTYTPPGGDVNFLQDDAHGDFVPSTS